MFASFSGLQQCFFFRELDGGILTIIVGGLVSRRVEDGGACRDWKKAHHEVDRCEIIIQDQKKHRNGKNRKKENRIKGSEIEMGLQDSRPEWNNPSREKHFIICVEPEQKERRHELTSRFPPVLFRPSFPFFSPVAMLLVLGSNARNHLVILSDV